jgi:drug/metabolite transporter (DMT)-like permease
MSDPDRPDGNPPGQPRGRSGSEPATARSPLRLRLVLAVLGGAFAALLGAALLLRPQQSGGQTVWGALLVLAAVAAAIDVVVIVRRLKTERRARP